MSCKEVTLGELSIGNKGNYGIAVGAVDYSEDLYTYLRITDINDDGTLNKSGLKSVDDANAKNYLLKPNDIVFARTGGSTGRAYFYDGTDGEFVYAGFLIRFSLDEMKVNPKYFKYYTLSNEYKGWIRSFNTGSTRGNINAKTYANMKLKLPMRAQQNFLVATLSCLDDKIEINNKINHNLEQMAQAIFKSWFVDFEPFDGEQPSDWHIGNLIDIADYLNGLAMQRFRPVDGEDGLPVLKIKDLRQGFCDSSSELCSPNIRNEYIIHDGDVVFSWSGSLLVDFWCGGDCGLNQHLFKVTSERYDKWFYYAWTCHHLANFVAIAAGKATTMGHIKREDLEKAKVLIPDNNSYCKIGKLLTPLYEKIISNRLENRKLIILRDTILPKLMTGEISAEKVSNE